MNASPTPHSGTTTISTADAPDPRRWWVLGVVAVCQLLVVLGASVVNIGLPQLQRALDISDADRPWVVTAYTLGVGGFLLLGGRIADYAGRRKVLVIGLVGFAVASALGGMAGNEAILFAARGAQGVFAALMMPAALSLLSVTFDQPGERATAFSVYGAMSGGGGAVGLVIGGVLTQYASWRWCLLLNVPVALLAAFLAARKIGESRVAGTVHYDVPGAVTVALGLAGLVYALSTAAANGWSSARTILLLAAAIMLLVAFVVVEARSRQPLLPLRILLNRTRAGAFLSMLLASAGLLGMFLFLTYYLQGTLHYSALRAGLAFLPISLSTVFATWITSRLLPRVAPRSLLIPGMALAGLGLWWLSSISTSGDYWFRVLPGELVVGFGMGLVFVTVASTALVGVAADDMGVASALVSTSQQVGGSLGTALLNTIAATAAAGSLAASSDPGVALVHGYQVALLAGAVVLGIGTVGAAFLVRAEQDDLPATPSRQENSI
jgi:EmrB/QacA subfamily drug resistance transporter